MEKPRRPDINEQFTNSKEANLKRFFTLILACSAAVTLPAYAATDNLGTVSSTNNGGTNPSARENSSCWTSSYLLPGHNGFTAFYPLPTQSDEEPLLPLLNQGGRTLRTKS
ncbi:hypothetical protein [Acidithiobacillus ferrooxidans]|uniref:hypothetical protein n=1 Tax=Acidithiobacillus ferrooxidans TaxID=920 RepID=UPI001D017137|nr:hypothetical protein [Acidithiobacillus ferrooxidans]